MAEPIFTYPEIMAWILLTNLKVEIVNDTTNYAETMEELEQLMFKKPTSPPTGETGSATNDYKDDLTYDDWVILTTTKVVQGGLEFCAERLDAGCQYLSGLPSTVLDLC